MQQRHTNRLQYFDEQAYTTEKYVIPFINKVKPVHSGMQILEIGCGEAGNLLPFLQMGCTCIGIDMSDFKVNIAREIFSKKKENENLTLIVDDIFNRVGELGGKFDLIIIRDTLEHIHGHEKFMQDVKQFLKPDGKIFLGFPPWQNPFGGHQQIAESKIISKVPFFHLLPKPIYLGILKMFGESQSSIDELLNIRSTRITIGQFKSMMKRLNYKIELEEFYFINPNYEVKFKLKPRLQSKAISSVPYLRNFLITTCYYLVSPQK